MLVEPLNYCHDTDSLVHLLDARIKFIGTLAFVLAVTATPNGEWGAFAVLFGIFLGLTLLARIGPVAILRRSVIALPFLLIVLVSIPFTQGGKALFSVSILRWTLPITSEGIEMFISVALKSWLSVLIVGLLLYTTPFTELVRGMQHLGLPAVLINIVSSMYRYLFVLLDEAERLERARASRSADPGGKGGGALIWQAKVLGGMIGSLFMRSYERSERIYQAMLSRNFAGEIRSLQERALGRKDLLLMTVFLSLLFVVEIWANL